MKGKERLRNFLKKDKYYQEGEKIRKLAHRWNTSLVGALAQCVNETFERTFPDNDDK